MTGLPVTGLSFAASDEGYVRELGEFVAVPSVSRDADIATMTAAAQWLAAQLAFAGDRGADHTGLRTL